MIAAASYVGVKDYVPPYLDPNLSIQDLMTGVSFASAGTGFDPVTPKISVYASLCLCLSCTYILIYIIMNNRNYIVITFFLFFFSNVTERD